MELGPHVGSAGSHCACSRALAGLSGGRALPQSWFTCRDGLGRRSVVWFEDLRSAAARFRLVGEYGLAGLSWWTADRPFLPALLLQQTLFDVARLP